MYSSPSCGCIKLPVDVNKSNAVFNISTVYKCYNNWIIEYHSNVVIS